MLTTEAAAERWSAVLSDCGTPGRVFLNDVPSDYLPAEGRTDWILRLAHSHEGVTRCCISSVDRMSIPGLGCGRSIGRKSLGGGPSWEAALLDARKSIANGRAAR